MTTTATFQRISIALSAIKLVTNEWEVFLTAQKYMSVPVEPPIP